MKAKDMQMLHHFDSAKYEACLYPGGKCTQKPIRAHSVQKSRILTNIKENGHVMMIASSRDDDGIPIGKFMKTSHKAATTFTGLCSTHDTSLFAPIEQGPIDWADEQHCFLISYRAILKELHTSVESFIKLQILLNKRVEEDPSLAYRPDPHAEYAVERGIFSSLIKITKDWFDNIYSSKDYSQLYHKVIKFNDVVPSFAASIFPSLEDIADHPLFKPWAALSVFPFPKQTVAIFSYKRDDKTRIEPYIEKITDGDCLKQQYSLSKFVIQHAENFAISPAFYNAHPHDKWDIIEKYFAKTIYCNLNSFNDPRLNLFWQRPSC